MIPGMANFFGKKGLGSSILRGAQRLNPIDLQRGQAARAFQHITDTSGGARHNYQAARKTHRGVGPSWSGRGGYGPSVRGYFAGDNLSDMASNMGMSGLGRTSAAARRKNMLTRRTVAGVAGGGLAAGLLFGEGNGISNAATAGGQVAGHGAMMGLIGRANPMAGAAYGAWAGLNMVRPGNNMGPF